MTRTDYAFPFRIDQASRQGSQSPYAQHVDEMIRQILLTTPGERADLPAFGCGLRQLLFAPNSDALEVHYPIADPAQPDAMARQPDHLATGHRHSRPGRRLLAGAGPDFLSADGDAEPAAHPGHGDLRWPATAAPGSSIRPPRTVSISSRSAMWRKRCCRCISSTRCRSKARSPGRSRSPAAKRYRP